MQAYDFFTENTKYPELLSPILNQNKSNTMKETIKQKEHEHGDEHGEEHVMPPCEEPHFFKFHLEVNPLDGSGVDYRLEMEMLPLNIIVNELVVERMGTC